MPKVIDLTGRRFGRLTVTELHHVDRQGAFWTCICDCGGSRTSRGCSLRAGHTKSCGCLQKENTEALATINTIHGQSRIGHKTIEYLLWCGAKARAIRNGLDFTIDLSDISIPELCPITEQKLERGNKVVGPNSPSLDRILSHLGYIKGNIWVISHRANTMKSNLTARELELFAGRIVDRMRRQSSQ